MRPCGLWKQFNYATKELFMRLYLLLQEEASRTKWKKYFTFLWRRSLSYRNQSIDFLCKSMGWFLYVTDYVRKGSNKVNYQQMKVWYVLYISNSDDVRGIYRYDVNIFSGKEWRLSKDVFRTLPNIWDKALS